MVGNFTVNIGNSISCTVSNAALNISFGTSLSTNKNYNASQNYGYRSEGTAYNITNDIISTNSINVTIKGSHFVSGSHVLDISNVSWASNESVPNGTNLLYPGFANLTTNFDTDHPVITLASPGNTTWYRLWVHIPTSQDAGSYGGNYTLQCEGNF